MFMVQIQLSLAYSYFTIVISVFSLVDCWKNWFFPLTSHFVLLAVFSDEGDDGFDDDFDKNGKMVSTQCFNNNSISVKFITAEFRQL